MRGEKVERIGRGDYSPPYPLNLVLEDVDLAPREVEVDRFAVAARWRSGVR